MTLAVDEERWRPRNAAEVCRVDVGVDLCGTDVSAHVAGESLGVEPDLGRVPHQVLDRQGALMVQKLIVHLPELTLNGRGLGRFSREHRVLVHVRERQGPKHVAKSTGAAGEGAGPLLGLTAAPDLANGQFNQRDQRAATPSDWS